jgi:hypothetical protein
MAAAAMISRAVTRDAGRFTKSSKRAAAQPKAWYRGLGCPIMLSAVLIAL